MTFESYYKNYRKELIERITLALGIAPSTFYQKLQKNNFTSLEKEKISTIVERPIDELFPNDQN